ncbi:MAG: hypothetical protein EOO60_06840 [Hymenobacter sp.]|nr:MAG: hypothetical protein EOO60_06840 [Hymenobacter sp.]
MNADLQAIISEAYTLFSPYTIGNTLDVCKACCITDAEERELVSTPLHTVSSDLFFRAYYESARRYTPRELWEMKHFLPRILELVSEYDFPTYAVEITLLRLNLDQPAAWAKPELKPELDLLMAFAFAYFQQSLAQYPLPSGDSLESILVMFGIAHFDLAPLLSAWAASDTPTSLLHLKDLLCYWVELAPDGSAQFTNPFATPKVNYMIINWLQTFTVHSAFRQRLEYTLLEGPPLSKKDAEELSLAYEILLSIKPV